MPGAADSRDGCWRFLSKRIGRTRYSSAIASIGGGRPVCPQQAIESRGDPAWSEPSLPLPKGQCEPPHMPGDFQGKIRERGGTQSLSSIWNRLHYLNYFQFLGQIRITRLPPLSTRCELRKSRPATEYQEATFPHLCLTLSTFSTLLHSWIIPASKHDYCADDGIDRERACHLPLVSQLQVQWRLECRSVRIQNLWSSHDDSWFSFSFFFFWMQRHLVLCTWRKVNVINGGDSMCLLSSGTLTGTRREIQRKKSCFLVGLKVTMA